MFYANHKWYSNKFWRSSKERVILCSWEPGEACQQEIEHEMDLKEQKYLGGKRGGEHRVTCMQTCMFVCTVHMFVCCGRLSKKIGSDSEADIRRILSYYILICFEL
jgi:hypothetical protein